MKKYFYKVIAFLSLIALNISPASASSTPYAITGIGVYQDWSYGASSNAFDALNDPQCITEDNDYISVTYDNAMESYYFFATTTRPYSTFTMRICGRKDNVFSPTQTVLPFFFNTLDGVIYYASQSITFTSTNLQEHVVNISVPDRPYTVTVQAGLKKIGGDGKVRIYNSGAFLY